MYCLQTPKASIIKKKHVNYVCVCVCVCVCVGACVC
jgi:hypothetical protein